MVDVGQLDIIAVQRHKAQLISISMVTDEMFVGPVLVVAVKFRDDVRCFLQFHS